MKDDVLEGNNDGQGIRESEHLLLHTMERKEEKVSNLYKMIWGRGKKNAIHSLMHFKMWYLNGS